MMQDNSACAQQQPGTDTKYVFTNIHSFFENYSKKYFLKKQCAMDGHKIWVKNPPFPD